LDKKEADPNFYYYYFQSHHGRSAIRSIVEQGAGASGIRGSDLKLLEVIYPPRDEQYAIAHILGTLDDKIALNRKMNETLEAIARALFKSWFVDFDPVHAKAEGRDPGLPKHLADLFPDSFETSELGGIPRGWAVNALDDFLCQRVERCSASRDTTARPYVPIDCISPKSLFLRESKPGYEAQSSLTKFYKGDILFGAMRPYFHKVCIAPFDGTTRTTAFVLYPRQADDFAIATLQLHHPDTIDFATRHSTGSTIPYAVWTDSLNTMQVIAPPLDVRKAFNRLVRPILLRIPETYFENLSFAALRDTLLPKLISGELRVKDAEKIIGRSL
jgi:type I restriction enzyme S subunit